MPYLITSCLYLGDGHIHTYTHRHTHRHTHKHTHTNTHAYMHTDDSHRTNFKAFG